VNDPASTSLAEHEPGSLAVVETIGGVLTDLVELAEQLPVHLDQAEAAARILDRLAEELGEAAGMLRGPSADLTAPLQLARLRQAFPQWTITWHAGEGWRHFSADRDGFPQCNATTGASLAARIFDKEGQPR
jgi:hypothetical protein